MILLMECRVGVVKSRIELPRIYSIPIPPSNLGKQFRMLLESGKDTDVNFDVDGEIVAAHKVVLAARSLVFRAQLLGPMRNKNTGYIKVEDIRPPIFKVKVCLSLFFLLLSIGTKCMLIGFTCMLFDYHLYLSFAYTYRSSI